MLFQHTAARRRLALVSYEGLSVATVSTHSRPKAAGSVVDVKSDDLKSFNTQPPEGGWACHVANVPEGSPFQHTAARRRLASFSRQSPAHRRFNTQPPEGGWVSRMNAEMQATVSTHSRPKAAGFGRTWHMYRTVVSTHSRPKAAGASLKSLAPSGFAAPISLGSQEKREREYNTAFSVTPAFAIS